MRLLTIVAFWEFMGHIQQQLFWGPSRVSSHCGGIQMVMECRQGRGRRMSSRMMIIIFGV